MFTSRLARFIAGKAGYTVSCLLAAVLLVVSGYAHKTVSELDELGKGITINGSSSVGAMNILVMGLESRTNYYGQTLSAQQLTETHSGSVYGVDNENVGAQDTDTLILIHIFAGGQKAVGFSIPRDDLVTYPSPTLDGITQGKVDQAYDFAYNQSLGQTYGSSDSSNERYTLANQAGQTFEIATVEALTGVHINNFIEVNLIGFFYLAQAFGGIEVCITPDQAGINEDNYQNTNLYDTNSGWNAVADGYNLAKGGTQYLHLAADQALAYVRDRDSLPNTDLDRTHRQQAVIDYVVWELKQEGAFSDLGKLTGLLSTADNDTYLITNSGFNLLDFATDMHALTGKNLTFETLPVASYATVDLNGSSQDVNTVSVPLIQQLVQKAFNPPPPVQKTTKATAKKAAAVPAASTVTVDVYNGGTTPGLAAQVSQGLVSLGYKQGAVANPPSSQVSSVTAATQVFYGAGTSANAAKIATEFGTTATSLTSLPAGHVEVLLGSTSTTVPAGLTSSAASGQGTATATPASSAASNSDNNSSTNNGAAGGTITVGANAKFGIPCVY